MTVEWQKVRVHEASGVDKDWDVFREAVTACARDACGIRKVGGEKIRKGSE